MMKLTFYLSCFFVSCSSSAAVNTDWAPSTYEKVILNTKIPEGIIFSRYTRAGSADGYTLGYFIGGKVVATRVLPTEMYKDLITKLRRSVFDQVTREVGLPCSDRITWTAGAYKKASAKTVVYCLSHPRQGRPDPVEAFGQWYKETRALFSGS